MVATCAQRQSFVGPWLLLCKRPSRHVSVAARGDAAVRAAEAQRADTRSRTAPLTTHPARSIGRNIKQLIDREDEPYCFRLHKERVYYVSERVMRQATSIARDDLVALGTCFGKFTKTKKFHLKVTALDLIGQYAKVRRGAEAGARRERPGARRRVAATTPQHARPDRPTLTHTHTHRPPPQYKVWVKPSSEMSFLYGNHVLKSGIARMTEAIPQYAGVVVLSMSNVPLGFGRAAHTTDACRTLDPTANAVLHQVDIGEYLRAEDELG